MDPCDGFHGWILLPDEIVEKARRGAEITNRFMSGRPSQLILTDNPTFMGNCGQAVFAIAVGFPVPDFEQEALERGRRWDGGEDFKNTGIDVKTTRHRPWSRPRLYIPYDKADGSDHFHPLSEKVKWFALVVWDPDSCLGRFVGWATKEEALAAEVKHDIKRPAHVMEENQLHTGYPGGQDEHLRGLQATRERTLSDVPAL